MGRKIVLMELKESYWTQGVRNLQAVEKELKDGMGWSVLCEGCGPTIVNDDGECLSRRCIKKHGV